MKNLTIANIIDNASKNRSYNSDNINNRRKYIDIIVKRIKEIANEKSITDKNQLKKEVLSSLFAEIQRYCEIANVQGRYFQIEAVEEIIANKDLIAKEYEYVKDDDKYTPDEKNDGVIYGANFRKSCRTAVGETLRSVRIAEAKMDFKTRKMIEEYNRLGEKERKIFEEKLKHTIKLEGLRIWSKTTEGTYIYKIHETAKVLIPQQREELKESQIQTLEYIFQRFKEYNFLQRYKKSNDEKMKLCGLSGYTYDISTGKHSKNDIGNDIGIEEVFSRKFLEKLDMEDIIILSMFWQNRYSKERKDLGEAIFAIDTLDLWEQILKSDDKITVSDKELQGIDNKIKCVKKIATSLLNNLKGKYKDKDLETGYKMISTEEEIDKIVAQEGKRYREIFSERLPSSQNDLSNDIDIYKLMLNQVENIYLIRNSILGCTIRSLLNSKKCRNWGLIIEDPEESDSEYVLIGIDYEGFNMPVRFHMKRELLISFLRTYKGQTKIPIYEGDKDFIIDGKALPTNILMPTNPRLKAILKEPGGNKKLKDHLMFVADSDKYPPHLKVTVKTSKGIRQVRPPRRYADLLTGEFFELDDGEYVKIEGLTGGNKDDGR